MQPRDFCFWLQGYFEVETADYGDRVLSGPKLSEKQVTEIRKHLKYVFDDLAAQRGDPVRMSGGMSGQTASLLSPSAAIC